MRADRSLRASAIAIALSPLLAAGGVSAQESCSRCLPDHPMLRDRFFLSAGALYAQSNVTASLNSGTLGIGTLIDFEEDLGLEDWKTMGLFQLRVRLWERFRVEAEYFSLNREHEQEATHSITWGSLNIPINTMTRARFDLEDFRVSFGYSFFKTQDKEIGFGVGAHIMHASAELETRNLGSQRASESAPLPVINMYARIALTDRWLFGMRVDRLSLTIGNIDGSIFSSGAEFVYQPWRHFNVGIGYREIGVHIKSTKESWRGEVNVSESGPFLFVGATF